MKHFNQLLDLLATDNGMVLRKESERKHRESINWDELEALAAKLDDESKETFIMGESSEVKELTVRLGLSSLDIVMNEIFDGDLTEDFFVHLGIAGH